MIAGLKRISAEELIAMTKVTKTYLALCICQACHSMEEMYFHLYEFFWTATGLFNEYLPFYPQFKMEADIFAILNIGLVTLILVLVPFLNAGKRWAQIFAWFWAVVEVFNGIIHLSGVFIFSEYVPGAMTAPFLLAVGIALIFQLRMRSVIAT